MKGQILIDSIISATDYLKMVTGLHYSLTSDFEVYEIESVCEQKFSKKISFHRADQIDDLQADLQKGMCFVPVICRERSLLGDISDCRKILYYVQIFNNSPLENKKDCYYLRNPEIPEASDVLCIYYNPDSTSEGQFVVEYINRDLIKKASKEMKSISNFFEFLDSEAYTELVDKGTKDYDDMVELLLCKIPDFTKDNCSDVQAFSKLIEFAYGK